MTEHAATTKEQATFRYPTSVKWGAGYFGDGYRYLTCDEATARAQVDSIYTDDPSGYSLQKRTKEGKWIFVCSGQS